MSDFKATMNQVIFPDPAGGAYGAPPDPVPGFKGPTSKGGSGQQGRERGRGSPPL